MFAHAPHRQNAAALEDRSNYPRRRLQRLRLPAQPDGFDYLSRHPPGEAAGNGFDFGELGHFRLPVYWMPRGFFRRILAIDTPLRG